MPSIFGYIRTSRMVQEGVAGMDLVYTANSISIRRIR